MKDTQTHLKLIKSYIFLVFIQEQTQEGPKGPRPPWAYEKIYILGIFSAISIYIYI